MESELFEMSPMMWIGASTKILARLIADEELGKEGILQYLAYVLRISKLYNYNTWSSLLSYDRECRIMQAATKDGWDVEPQGIASTMLVSVKQPRDRQGYRSSNSETKKVDRWDKPANPTTPTGEEICKLFNASRCGFSNCRYAHACYICYGPHPARRHGEENGEGVFLRPPVPPPTHMPPWEATPATGARIPSSAHWRQPEP